MARTMMIAVTVAALALTGCASKPKRLPPVADGTPGG